MTSLRAGFGRVEISAGAVGAELVGYAQRVGRATGVHDPLHARAMVLEHGEQRVAICSLELGHLNEDILAVARERIAARGLVPADAVFVGAVHTHSGPLDLDRGCWPDGVEVLIEEAVSVACERLTPARIGAGYGMLHGKSYNRRRFEDPVDPAVFVIRVDDLEGRPLGVWHGFGAHPVVLGVDNLLISADWPGASSRQLEAVLGEGAVALFGQGACADVNPVTPTVRGGMARAPVLALTGTAYYGAPEEASDVLWCPRGGTFDEVEAFARMVVDEVVRVYRGIVPGEVDGLWTRQLTVELANGCLGEPPCGFERRLGPRAAPDDPMEVMLVGIDGPGILLVSEPGEVFADTGIGLRRDLRAAGFAHPFLVTHANGRRAYLPPAHAYADGGYEVEWALARATPKTLQDDIRGLVLDAVAAMAP